VRLRKPDRQATLKNRVDEWGQCLDRRRQDEQQTGQAEKDR
jgi:hypothetical protein